MSEQYQCWQCGEALQDLILPMSRREECVKCGADQHCCKMCQHFTARGCDEERAETVSDTEKANFCDYFSPSASAFNGQYQDKSQQAKAKLAALFGDETAEQDGPDTSEPGSLSPAEEAERKLAQMLNGKL